MAKKDKLIPEEKIPEQPVENGVKNENPDPKKEVKKAAPEKLSPEQLKAAGLPPDFGPSHPWWKIPSKINRYIAAGGKVTGLYNDVVIKQA